MRSDIEEIIKGIEWNGSRDYVADVKTPTTQLLQLFEKMCNEARSRAIHNYHDELLNDYLQYGTNAITADAYRKHQYTPEQALKTLKTKLGAETITFPPCTDGEGTIDLYAAPWTDGFVPLHSPEPTTKLGESGG